MLGRLITFEGIDGCGKTTLAKHLYAALQERAVETILTKEPGGTPLGISLRTILQTQNPKVCDLSEYLLFAADRAQHFATLIIPALQKGCLVLADRLADSSLAYQGYGRGLDLKHIAQVNAWAMQNIEPDLTVYVQIDPDTAMQRITKRNEIITNFEQEKKDFWQRVTTGYQAIFKDRNNVLVIDGTLSTDTQVKLIIKQLQERSWL